MNYPSREEFEPYFNCADEIDVSLRHGVDQSKAGVGVYLTLADLESGWVASARTIADRYGLSWPPSLPEAEEFALDIIQHERSKKC